MTPCIKCVFVLFTFLVVPGVLYSVLYCSEQGLGNRFCHYGARFVGLSFPKRGINSVHFYFSILLYHHWNADSKRGPHFSWAWWWWCGPTPPRLPPPVSAAASLHKGCPGAICVHRYHGREDKQVHDVKHSLCVPIARRATGSTSPQQQPQRYNFSFFFRLAAVSEVGAL